ncbi:hypothetical protein [Zestomonas thermotolerans]|jgi:hypothetical protein|uniref:hypothetical protein n=1 Tax=Zestomonas thermotolerans TaxID=157784 RepID=UPI0004B63584|nr:hypothetical protein [Pseudomonas thermotolerans]
MKSPALALTLALAGLPALGAEPGTPGNPTPAPYVQPAPYQVPRGISPSHPPLLDNRPPSSLTSDPRARELPLLEEQLRRNRQGEEPARLQPRDDASRPD